MNNSNNNNNNFNKSNTTYYNVNRTQLLWCLVIFFACYSV
jgi:hypothetical protein